MSAFSVESQAMDLRDLDRRALEAAGKVIAGVRPEHLTGPTPCAEWTLGELLRHMVSENLGFAGAFAGRPADPPAWDRGELGADPHHAYQESVAAVSAAFATPDAHERQVEIREFGVFPGRVAMGMHVIDFVVHGWDVAAAVGAPYPVDEQAAAGALAIASRLPDTPRLRGPGGPFGAVVPVPADASDLERLLGLLGRSPAWTPSC